MFIEIIQSRLFEVTADGPIRRGRTDQCCLLGSWLAFSHFPRYPEANWALLLLIPGWVVCVHSSTLWVSPTNSPVSLVVSPAASTPTGFSVRDFEALFTHSGTLGCVVCLTPQLFLPVYLHTNVGQPALSVAALP